MEFDEDVTFDVTESMLEKWPAPFSLWRKYFKVLLQTLLHLEHFQCFCSSLNASIASKKSSKNMKSVSIVKLFVTTL